MRCLIVVPSLMRAGAETQAVNLANGLSSSGHLVHLCSFERQLDQRNRLDDKVTFHQLRRKSKYDLELIPALARIIDDEDIEVALGVMQFAALVVWLAARRSKRKPPVIATVHTTVNRGLKQELHDRLIYRQLLKRLPAVIFVCRHQRDHWVLKYPELEPMARVVYNGVDPKKFRRSQFQEMARKLRTDLGIAESAFVFTCVAAFRREKGHKLLVEAFSKLPGNAYLVFAGDGELQSSVRAAAHSAGLTDRVRFLGNVPDIRPVIVASNATVLASTAVETFSMAMLESMALEVPMIATTIGGMAEAIIHGDTGLLCHPGDAECLADQMRFLLEHPSEAGRLGRAAAEKVFRCFTLEGMVAGNEVVFGEVLAAPARVPVSTL